ncbi:phosphodiesterase [Novimethylophilus kurashikiensis]|uniref:Phosphodiesterase n=1 Tax=Novimethylophilus kurashikiensis TaxID=1825523 RepID=A0A2R5F9K2_9PROT|nr:HD domain-containing phosphohydrolase [Novimethylophilus kurashikiensis]GBG14218.1 phosphodiesterase [Novimethylophilus kurashikiensis]
MDGVSDEAATEAAIQIASSNYLKTLTELGDSRSLITTQDIYSSTGLKLIKKGVRFNSKLYDQLVHHKLIPDLDQSLGIENPITTEELAEQLNNLLAYDARLLAFKANFSQTDVLVRVLKQVQLNPAMAFKLTVMREVRPRLLQHSLYVTIVSIYIGIRANLLEEELIGLATAALLHDIGIMHMDHRLLDDGHVLTEQEWNHLYAHPVTAYLILKEFPEYEANITNAILEHHERLDGSGYPRGLRGNRIGRMGQIIALAVIVSSRFEQNDENHGGLRLETILKLNSRRYGHEYIGYLDIFYKDQDIQLPSITPELQELTAERIRTIAMVLQSWAETYLALRDSQPVGHFINERISNLEVAVFDAGFDPNPENTMLLEAENDPRFLLEMRVLSDETFWQIREVLKEIHRRWPLLDHEDKTSALRPIADWVSETRALTAFSDQNTL